VQPPQQAQRRRSDFGSMDPDCLSRNCTGSWPLTRPGYRRIECATCAGAMFRAVIRSVEVWPPSPVGVDPQSLRQPRPTVENGRRGVPRELLRGKLPWSGPSPILDRKGFNLVLAGDQGRDELAPPAGDEAWPFTHAAAAAHRGRSGSQPVGVGLFNASTMCRIPRPHRVFNVSGWNPVAR
jgi:hypothetical protein